MIEDGKALCATCHEEYYDPEQYDSCYGCYLQKRSEEDEPDEQ